MNETVIDIGIIATQILIGLAAAAVVISAIFQLISNFKKAKGGLIGLAALLVIIFVSYLLSTNETYETVGPNVSQLIGGGINATMALIGIGLLAAVFTEIYKLFR
jgi:hypothetical protein